MDIDDFIQQLLLLRELHGSDLRVIVFDEAGQTRPANPIMGCVPADGLFYEGDAIRWCPAGSVVNTVLITA